MCPCESAECGPVQLFETDKRSRRDEKSAREREESGYRCAEGREGKRARAGKGGRLYRAQQKLIRRCISAGVLANVIRARGEQRRRVHARRSRSFAFPLLPRPSFSLRLRLSLVRRAVRNYFVIARNGQTCVLIIGTYPLIKGRQTHRKIRFAKLDLPSKPTEVIKIEEKIGEISLRNFFGMTSTPRERCPIRRCNGSLNYTPFHFGRLGDRRPRIRLESVPRAIHVPGFCLIYENIFAVNRPSGPQQRLSSLL